MPSIALRAALVMFKAAFRLAELALWCVGRAAAADLDVPTRVRLVARVDARLDGDLHFTEALRQRVEGGAP